MFKTLSDPLNPEAKRKLSIMPPANTEQQPPSCLQQLPGIRNTFGSLPAFFSSAGDPKVPISYDNTGGFNV